MYKYNKLFLSINIIILLFINNCYSYDTSFGVISSKQKTDKPIAFTLRATFLVNGQTYGDYSVFQPFGYNSSYSFLYSTPIDYLDHTMVVLNETCQITQNHLYPIFYLQCQEGGRRLSNGPNISSWKYSSTKLTYDDVSNTLMGLLDTSLYIYSIANDSWSTITVDPTMNTFIDFSSISPIPTYFDSESRLFYTIGKTTASSCLANCNYVNQTIVVFDLNKNSSQLYWVTPTDDLMKLTQLGIVGRKGMIYISGNFDTVGKIYSFNPSNNVTTLLTSSINQAFPMITGYNSRYVGFVSYGGGSFQLYDIDKNLIEYQNGLNLFYYYTSTTLYPQYYFTLTSIIPVLVKQTPTPTPTTTKTPTPSPSNNSDEPNNSNSQTSLIVMLLSLFFPSLLVILI